MSIVPKPESREFIANWLPGSGCEDYVMAATVTARKPQTAAPKTAAAVPPAAPKAVAPAAAVCSVEPAASSSRGGAFSFASFTDTFSTLSTTKGGDGCSDGT